MTDTPRRTLAEAVRFEPDKIKGSRHIATLAPVASEAEASTVVAACREEFSGACHHAFAWVLGRDGQHVRASDDGEPAGSAGRPMLGVLQHADLVQVVAVVSRIFGGTRLGVGGLVRAYGGAVSAAIDHASIVPVRTWLRLQLLCDWPHADAVQRVLDAFESRNIERAYTDRISVELELPEPIFESFVAAIRDATNGTAELSVPRE